MQFHGSYTTHQGPDFRCFLLGNMPSTCAPNHHHFSPDNDNDNDRDKKKTFPQNKQKDKKKNSPHFLLFFSYISDLKHSGVNQFPPTHAHAHGDMIITNAASIFPSQILQIQSFFFFPNQSL